MNSKKSKVQSVALVGLFSLAMLITGSIDNIRNLPTVALFGSKLIFFFVLGAIFFLLPTALVSAELTSTWSEEGGIFHWVRKAFGDRLGFLAVWLQWVNTMVWYPTILSFIAGMLAYLINPDLVHDKTYLVSVILIVFWVVTLVSLRGVHLSAMFATVCTVVGMILPMTFIIILMFIWVYSHHPLAIHISWANAFPSLGHAQSWVSLTAIMTSFLGMELAAVHVRKIRDPQKTFPKALMISVAIILVTMILGAISIALVLPSSQIHLVDGIMQAFEHFFKAFHILWLVPILATMILIGSVGMMVNWIISPARGLLQAARFGFLPRRLEKENKYGASQSVLLIQAMLVSFICLAFLYMPSINGAYWLLTDLSTELYMMMYVLMFSAAIALRFKYREKSGSFKIWGGAYGTLFVCVLGIISCIVTIVIGFFPPEEIDVGGMAHYAKIFSIGIFDMLLPGLLIIGYHYFYHKKRNNK